MVDVSRRGTALGAALAAAAGAAALAAPRVAKAQAAASTWQRIQDTKIVRLGAPISEPFLFRDLTNSNAPGGVRVGDVLWRGFSVNCAKEMAEALGAQLQLVDTTYGNAVAGLQANQFDIIFALDGTVRRAAAIDFVPQPLFMYGTAILARADQKIATWEEINANKLRIGVPVGTTMETEIMRRAPDAVLDRFQNIPEMIAALNSGRVHAVSASLTSMTLASARIPGTIVAMPAPHALFPMTAGIRYDTDPRWRNFLTTSFAYLAYSGFVQKTLNEAYAFRGVDITKVSPVVIR